MSLETGCDSEGVLVRIWSMASQNYQVFVGNVPYGTTEERLRTVFSSVGRVVNVRVMADRGDPKKGYAFVEYDNPDTALSAIRNLSQVELDGRRLRVGFSNNSNLEDIARQRGITVPSSARDAPAAQQPQQPTKTIDSVVSQLSLHEMYDIIGHLKELAETKPDELRLLLISHPQIAEAIVQMQVKIGMIKPFARNQAPEPPPPPPHMPAPPPAPQTYAPPQPPQPPLPAFPPMGLPMPPGQALPQPPPQAWPPAMAGAPQIPGLPPGVTQQEILQQLMQLSPEQLQQIDPTQRQIIMQLRSAMGMQ